MTSENTNMSDIQDNAKLTEEEKVLLLKRAESDETLLPEGHELYNAPGYLTVYTESIKRVLHTIYPDSTPEQLSEVERSVTQPIYDMLNNIAYHTTAMVANALPAVRQEHILQPPVRYMLDYSLSALLGIVSGAMPGMLEKLHLENIGEDLSTWNTTLEDVEIPEVGIPVEFVHGNRILRGKLCYFSYLSEDGSAQVMTDILTYWCQEYNGFVHTHSVVYWRPLNGDLETAETTNGLENESTESI